MNLVLHTNDEYSYPVNGVLSTQFPSLITLALMMKMMVGVEVETPCCLPKLYTQSYAVCGELANIPMKYFCESKSMSYYRNAKIIDDFRLLEFNWNGNKAEKIPEAVRKNASLFLDRIRGISDFIRVFPTARDSIQFEYTNNGKYVEAELFENQFTLFVDQNEGEFESDFDSIEKLAKEYLAAYV